MNLSNLFRPARRKRRVPVAPRRRLGCEALEDRLTPSTIVWTNRGTAGNDSDGFAAAFGSQAAVARGVVDAAIDDWSRIIKDFNTQDFGTLGTASFIPAGRFHLTI